MLYLQIFFWNLYLIIIAGFQSYCRGTKIIIYVELYIHKTLTLEQASCKNQNLVVDFFFLHMFYISRQAHFKVVSTQKFSI
jgi:hypothetical protein